MRLDVHRNGDSVKLSADGVPEKLRSEALKFTKHHKLALIMELETRDTTTADFYDLAFDAADKGRIPIKLYAGLVDVFNQYTDPWILEIHIENPNKKEPNK